MEMTWTKAGEERKGEGDGGSEVGRRLESCPGQVKVRLSPREVFAVLGGDQQCH